MALPTQPTPEITRTGRRSLPRPPSQRPHAAGYDARLTVADPSVGLSQERVLARQRFPAGHTRAESIRQAGRWLRARRGQVPDDLVGLARAVISPAWQGGAER